MEETLNKLRQLGYTIQLPKGRDHTLYLVRQAKDYTKQIFLEYTKKEVKVYVYTIFKTIRLAGILTPLESELLLDYVVELGYDGYTVVEEEVEN